MILADTCLFRASYFDEAPLPLPLLRRNRAYDFCILGRGLAISDDDGLMLRLISTRYLVLSPVARLMPK